MNFGEYLKKCREERQLSLRELSKLSNIDHAYIYRLETGQKDDPSPEGIRKLVSALKLSGRKLFVFRLLAEKKEAPLRFVEAALDESIEADDAVLTSAAGMKFRGKPPKTKEDWGRIIEQVREILQRG